jgi:hypothetical protein
MPCAGWCWVVPCRPSSDAVLAASPSPQIPNPGQTLKLSYSYVDLLNISKSNSDPNTDQRRERCGYSPSSPFTLCRAFDPADEDAGHPEAVRAADALHRRRPRAQHDGLAFCAIFSSSPVQFHLRVRFLDCWGVGCFFCEFT